MKKPSIEKLFDAIREFGMASQQAGINVEKWKKVRADLRTKLDTLGIADAFDWGEQ
jgi:hypothetical protein